MGIVNVTADSFADGGHHPTVPAAIAHARRLVADGADILDIGGESTRPGAPEVPVQHEMDRVIPVIAALAGDGAYISVDTRKPEVMAAAIAAGAQMVNDVEALQAPGAATLCADRGVSVCLMHMQGSPRTMQVAPVYGDVVREVRAFLGDRAASMRALGLAAGQIYIDPGFGFGKTVEHNRTLFHQLGHLVDLGYPVVVGLSRKSTLGAITGRNVGDRAAASVAAAVLAAVRGASIVRVHDVAETVDAMKVYRSLW
jgi:dihydropteroate synthase